MPDETMDSLKQAYMKDSDSIIDDCPMAEQITDYAFGELNPSDAEKAQEHLKTCRSCLNMYMDIKMADEDARQMQGEKVEVLTGLQNAINQSKKPTVSTWQKINDAISDFFGAGFGFKPVAGFATAMVILLVAFFMFQDQGTHDPFSIEIMMHGRVPDGIQGRSAGIQGIHGRAGRGFDLWGLFSGSRPRSMKTPMSMWYFWTVPAISNPWKRALSPEKRIYSCPMGINGSIWMTTPEPRNYTLWLPGRRLAISAGGLKS